jgi:hypothetical protein
MKKGLLLTTLLLFVLSACNNANKQALVLSSDYAGTWEVVLNIIFDECEVIEGDGSGLVLEDIHEVLANNNELEVLTNGLVFNNYFGGERGEGSFTVSALLAGDILGNGVYCEVIEDFAYNNVTSESADIVYTARIVCDDGDRCDSLMRGTAARL